MRSALLEMSAMQITENVAALPTSSDKNATNVLQDTGTILLLDASVSEIIEANFLFTEIWIL